MKKSKLFASSCRCPFCLTAFKMRVSDYKEFAYRCLGCHFNFYSFECPSTVSDYKNEKGEYNSLYMITLRKQNLKWYEANKDIIKKISNKYGVLGINPDYTLNLDGDPDLEAEAVIDFGWVDPPDEKCVQNFTDEILNLCENI